LRQGVVLREELLDVDDGASGADLLLEAVYEASHRLDQLALALSERRLLVLDVIDLVLILLDKFLVPIREDSQRTVFLRFLCLILAVYLRLLKTIFNLFELLSEATKDVFNGLSLLLESDWRCQERQLFLLHFKCKLVTYLAQFLFEVHFVVDGLLRLVGQQRELLREQGDFLLLAQVLSHDRKGVFRPALRERVDQATLVFVLSFLLSLRLHHFPGALLQDFNGVDSDVSLLERAPLRLIPHQGVRVAA